MLPEEKGLTSQEAKARLEKFGANILPEKPPPSDFTLLFSQLKNPLVYILLIAGLVTFVLGHSSDTLVIFLAVFINTIFGFFQERKAEHALHALKKLIQPSANVIRDGEIKKIGISEVVPGDICVVGQGDKIPADGVLTFANRFFVSEAILTGESLPVEKKENGKVFMGTVVTSGRAFLEVGVTGKDTEIGKIALSIQEPEEETPLKKQLKSLSRQLSYLVFGLTAFVFLAGLITGQDLVDLLTTSVALAVSAIPEGLLVGLTVVLAIGMQRILRRNGLVRRLVSAETLGGVTTICIDKTGTLTEGKMKVSEIIGDEKEVAQQILIANDLDDPLVIAAHEWARGKFVDHKSLIAGNPRLDSIPFSPKERFFASLNKSNKSSNVIFVNGAPEFLLGWSNLDEGQKSEVISRIKELTKQGKRLIGLARKEVGVSKKKLGNSDVKKGLTWVGIVSFWDPIRPGVAEALQKAQTAGLKIVTITGDYADTASAVLGELRIEVAKNEIMLGEELEKMTAQELSRKVKSVKLFARTSPDQKLKIVEALKKNGEIVGMMGDGVNDAPALMKADIGIVVGEATDVAKESADLILLDSNFATVISAIEEGRGIFEKIRKITLYLISDSFEEIIAVVATIIFGLPLAVTAAQILWINLISDGFPNLALTVDPTRESIMNERPRNSKEPIVSSWMRNLILIVSFFGGVSAFILFLITYKNTNDVSLSRSAAFASLGINSLIYVFSVRALNKPFWESRVFSNKWLILAVLGGLALQIAPFIFPSLGDFLSVVPLDKSSWILVFGAAVLMFIMIEASKVVFRYKLR